MQYVFYASLLFVAVLFVGAFGFGFFWLGTLLFSKPQYHNKLGLTFLSRFSHFQKATRKKSLFGAGEELLHIAETFEAMRLARRSLVDLLVSEADREACRKDLLEGILKKAKERLKVEQSTPRAETSGSDLLFEIAVDFVSKRKWRAQREVLFESLIDRANVEFSRLEGWRPSVVEEARLALQIFKGGYVIRREAERASAVMLWLDESGEFDVYRREGRQYAHLLSFVAGQPIKVDLVPPAESGRLEIIRKKDNELEPIALP